MIPAAPSIRAASIAIVAVLAAAAPARLAAQGRAPVPGDTVRIVAAALPVGSVQGELVAERGDTLFVRRYGATIAVPLARVERIDLRRRRSWLVGLARGVAIGAPTGLASGYLIGSAMEGGGDDCADDCGLLPVIYGATGFVGGALLGALIGGSAPGGRWVRAAPRSGPSGGGVALSVGMKI